MSVAVIIPARYGSTRFPGKPLAKIGKKTMLSRVVDVAKAACQDLPDAKVIVATEDERIANHASGLGVPVSLTSANCRTGTDRVKECVDSLDHSPDFIINFQGDAPFTPPDVLKALISEYQSSSDQIDINPAVITPVHQLSWDALDRLRESKRVTPFSGTTVVMSDKYQAYWFSKQILPAIRSEKGLRKSSSKSQVWQHIGIYGYPSSLLATFISLPTSTYEHLEGLEQLRLLENGYIIQCVPVEVKSDLLHSGIDSPEDIKTAEALL